MAVRPFVGVLFHRGECKVVAAHEVKEICKRQTAAQVPRDGVALILDIADHSYDLEAEYFNIFMLIGVPEEIAVTQSRIHIKEIKRRFDHSHTTMDIA